MSAKTIKRDSGWSHKADPPVVYFEMHGISRTADRVIVPSGSLDRLAYAQVRLENPEANLPAFYDLPLLPQ